MGKMKNMIRVVTLEVGKYPEIKEVENELSTFQEFVGGWIEVVRFYNKSYLMVCNEEGKLQGLEPNFSIPHDIVMGNVMFVGFNDEGDFESIPEEEIDFVLDYARFNLIGHERTDS